MLASVLVGYVCAEEESIPLCRNVHCVVPGIYKPSGKPQWYTERNGAALTYVAV